MGDASSQEGERVGVRRETYGLMASWELFSSLPMIEKAKRILVILAVFFGHFGALRSSPGVTDRWCATQ